MAKKALGKGLGAIISNSATPIDDMENAIVEDSGRIQVIDIKKIKPNPDQPRLHFDESEIKGLSESIKSVGLIQPIIIRMVNNDYVVVAGERRLRAAKEAGLEEIKSIIIEADEEKNLTLALIENIQRSDLDPIEEAKAYKVLINRFKLKQQEVAKRVGKERATISNSLRLLNLPDDIQNALSSGKISAGHAKVLLSIPQQEKQIEYYKQIVNAGLSVRGLESLLQEEPDGKFSSSKSKEIKKKDSHIKQMEDKLVSVLGTKVEIKHASGKGKIEISYYSLDDFDRLVEMLV